MHRKSVGLSQDELAILLGLERRAVLAKYELGMRLPDLRTIVAMEVVFDEPPQSVFAGIAQQVRAQVSGRARALLEGMTDKPGPAAADKWRTVARLARLEEEDSIEW